MNGVNLSSPQTIDTAAGLTVAGTLTLGDDLALALGTGGTVNILYETADGNANALIFVAPEGGGTDVPAFIFGDATILNADLGWFNGLTEPSIVVVNDAKDAYVRIDSGDDGVAGSQGIYFKAAADEDIELINLSVTGTPRIFWDESEDAFSPNKGITFGVDALSIAANDINANYLLLKARDTNASLVEIARIVGAADPYFQIGRDDTGVALNAVTDMLVLQAGAGTNNEAANFGLGISVKLGNAASEVEERCSIDFVLNDATNGAETSLIKFNVCNGVTMSTVVQMYKDSVTIYPQTNHSAATTWTASNDSSAVADTVFISGYEISAGHRALCIGSEEVVVAETDETKFSHKYPVRINGATYNIMLCAT